MRVVNLFESGEYPDPGSVDSGLKLLWTNHEIVVRKEKLKSNE